jgi:hypothetical protein
MNSLPLFGLSVVMSFVAFGIVTRIYIWPRLRTARREQALIALTVPHAFRLDFFSRIRTGAADGGQPKNELPDKRNQPVADVPSVLGVTI